MVRPEGYRRPSPSSDQHADSSIHPTNHLRIYTHTRLLGPLPLLLPPSCSRPSLAAVRHDIAGVPNQLSGSNRSNQCASLHQPDGPVLI